MSNTLLRSLLGLLVLCVSSQAKDWPAIPPEIWAIKQDVGPTAHGAVITDEWVRYGNGDTDLRRRIRIFREAGKGAAALPVFNAVYEFEGRTVQPDGQVTPFNKAKDLVSASLKVGRWESKRQSLLPPGLTSDCVVDLHYRVGTYIHGTWAELPILSGYPIEKKVVEITAIPTMGFALLGVDAFRPERKTSGGYATFTFKDLPADEPEPYSLPTSAERPLIVFYYQPSGLRLAARKGPKNYWDEVGTDYYKFTHTKNLSLGRAYEEWSKALRAGLEGDPMAKAGAILMRLEEQIQNGSNLSFAELAALPKKAAEELMVAEDLDATVKRKRTSANGMYFIFFQLLMDEGLEPKLLLVADRNQRVFRYDFPNIYQFTDTLIGVTAKSGDLVWFNPSSRFSPVGIVDPDYQGTQGLLVNSKDWSCNPFMLGIQDARANRSLYEFQLNLDDEETFSMKGRFSGFPEFVERKKYFSLEPKEQERKLKEGLEEGLKAYTLRKMRVENATDCRKNLIWTIEGVKEAEEGRRRAFSPFPGLPYPLSLPEAWPETRKGMIILPYCRIFTAISKFKVPRGWTLGKDPDLVQGNEFGRVIWKVKSTSNGDEESVEVTFFVEVKKMASPASSYAAFQSFMGWIETAVRRTLALDRAS